MGEAGDTGFTRAETQAPGPMINVSDSLFSPYSVSMNFSENKNNGSVNRSRLVLLVFK